MFSFADNKLSISEVWKAGFELYKLSLSKIWYLVLITSLVVMSHVIIFRPDISAMATADMHMASGPTMPMWHITPFSFIYNLIVFLIGAYLAATIIHRMFNLVSDENVGLGKSFSYVMTKMVVLISSMIVVYLACIIGAFLLVLPAIFLAILLMFNIPLILFDDAGWLDALIKSAKLVWSNWWRTFLIMLVPGLIMGLVQIIIGSLAGGAHNPWAYLIVVSVVTAVLAPYMYAVYLVQYNDLKQRKTTDQSTPSVSSSES